MIRRVGNSAPFSRAWRVRGENDEVKKDHRWSHSLEVRNLHRTFLFCYVGNLFQYSQEYWNRLGWQLSSKKQTTLKCRFFVDIHWPSIRSCFPNFRSKASARFPSGSIRLIRSANPSSSHSGTSQCPRLFLRRGWLDEYRASFASGLLIV